MNARGWLEDGVDLALVGAVALWIGIAGAFLASLAPTGGREAAVQNTPPPGGAAAGDILRPAAEESPAGRADSPADELPAGLLDRLAARNAAGNALAVAISITEGPHGVPTPAPRPRTPPPERRGVLVDLGPMPENCARLYEIAADALDRASAVAREMLAHTHRSAQSGEATSAAILAETTSPRLRAAAMRLRRMPARPKGGAA